MPVSSSSSSSISSRNQQQVVEVGSALFSEGSSYSAAASTQLTKRTSTSWFCEYKTVPQLLTAAQYVLGLQLNHMEEPQIVRYETGQEFTWHYDEVPTQLLANGGQRMATLLVYLNTVQEGGGTVFRDLKQEAPRRRGEAADDNQQNIVMEEEEEEEKHMLTVQPVQGRACIFFPATFANGKNDAVIARPDDRTLHKGQVAMDEKRIVQIWIHQDTYKATLPSALNRQEDAIPAIQQLARQRQWDQETAT
jgi:prolyl 4-hydroxylase